MKTYNTDVANFGGNGNDDEDDGNLKDSFNRDELVEQWKQDQANGNNEPDPNAPLNPLV